MNRVSITLPPELINEIRTAAHTRRISVSQAMRDLLRGALAQRRRVLAEIAATRKRKVNLAAERLLMG
jgi:metal-responsive CopG/Arc/MetJ family transcriptional regulator